MKVTNRGFDECVTDFHVALLEERLVVLVRECNNKPSGIQGVSCDPIHCTKWLGFSDEVRGERTVDCFAG